MSTSPRPKYQSTSPARFDPSLPENSRKEYKSAEARPSGRSGGAPVSTPHRVSASRRRSRKAARA